MLKHYISIMKIWNDDIQQASCEADMTEQELLDAIY